MAITSRTAEPTIIGSASTAVDFFGYIRNFSFFSNVLVEAVTNSTVISQPVFSDTGHRPRPAGDDAYERTLQEVTLEAIDLPPGAKAVLALQLPPGSVTLFDPVTHVAQLMTVEGEPTRERQSLSVVLSTQEDRAVRPGVAPSGRVTLRPRWMWPATRFLPGK